MRKSVVIFVTIMILASPNFVAAQTSNSLALQTQLLNTYTKLLETYQKLLIVKTSQEKIYNNPILKPGGWEKLVNYVPPFL